MKQFVKYYFYLGLVVVSYSCAQIVAPTGGEKDSTPPQVEKVRPPQESLNFKEKTIEVEFDEFIQLEKLKDQLVVSPPLKYDLRTRIVGKTLKIEIKDTLKKNQTYVINFGDAIVDITERNPVPAFKYVFSTGNTLDTLRLNGKVIDAFNLEVQDKFLVMLYKNLGNDSIPLKELPDYLAETDKNGNFSITNLQSGSYKLFALKDGNRNLLFDRPDEAIAYSKQAINIDSKNDSLILYSFVEENQEQFIENQILNDNQLILDFKLPVGKFKHKVIEGPQKKVLRRYGSQTRDSIIFWWREMPRTKISMRVEDGKRFSDTISFKIDSLDKKATFKLEKPIVGKQNYYAPIALKFNFPVRKMDSNLIHVFDEDSLPIKYKLNRPKGQPDRINLSFQSKEDEKYRLQILSKAIVSNYGQRIDSIQSTFTFNKPQDFGTLSLKLKIQEKSKLIIQLIDKKGKVLQQKNTKGRSVVFEHIRQGDYRLKLIVDRNGNGKWDTGDYLKNKQAERTVIYNEDISIRSNWDKDIEWIIK